LLAAAYFFDACLNLNVLAGLLCMSFELFHAGFEVGSILVPLMDRLQKVICSLLSLGRISFKGSDKMISF
jgi:hypothetical protein